MPRRVAVVSHTHWDREWHQSFQQLRHQLVAMLDRLLPRLRDDPAAVPFHLDGQLAVVDDYLDRRPDAARLVGELVAAGRLTLGPWYVLMDEFLVSGETIVRDLQLGLRRAAELGGASEVGYLPDMFGHVAQMPQVLRLAGMAHAVVWRGVPGAVDRTAFWWRAPDGSTVRAEYLPVGYGIGAHLPATARDLVRRLEGEEVELAGLLRDDDAILLMNGGDHLEPPDGLWDLMAEVNAGQDHFRCEGTTLAAYLDGASTDALPEWTGELRSAARANLLAGVVSNRVDIRRRVAAAERALERRAEPLAALWLDRDDWPGTALDAAWLEVIRNAAHDSVCACSSDDVVVTVASRAIEATAIAGEVATDALAAAASATGPGPVVVNPSARPRSGVVEVVVPGTQPPPGAQVVEVVTAGATEVTGVGADLARILGELTARGWLQDGSATTAALVCRRNGVQLDLVVDAAADRGRSRGAIDGAGRPVGPVPAAAADRGTVMAEAWVQAGARRHEPLTVTVRREPSTRVLLRTPVVPGFGWAQLATTAGEPPLPSPTVDPVRAAGTRLDNGRLTVEVDPADGTFAVGGLRGLGRLVDDGDEGDTYTYSPPGDDHVVERPVEVAVDVVEPGPVRGVLRVRRRYRWPAAVIDGRRQGVEDVEVVTELALDAGGSAVSVTHTFDNRCRDHRLRAWLPLGERVEHSEAGCAFASVRRPILGEGGPSERATGTFPARDFVRAGALTVVVDGVAEYELVDGGTALALTLLRATGYLSRPAPAARPNAAGPPLAVEGPQMLGPQRCRYAVAVGPVDPWALVDEVSVPLEVVVGQPSSPPSEGGLSVTPDAVGSRLVLRGAEVSSVRRVDGSLEVRVFNPRPSATVVQLPGRRGRLVDLRGGALEGFADSFALRAWGIATVRLDDSPDRRVPVGPVGPGGHSRPGGRDGRKV